MIGQEGASASSPEITARKRFLRRLVGPHRETTSALGLPYGLVLMVLSSSNFMSPDLGLPFLAFGEMAYERSCAAL